MTSRTRFPSLHSRRRSRSHLSSGNTIDHYDAEDDYINTPSPKRPRSESDHEYDFLAEALLSSTPPYSPPTEPPSLTGFDSTFSDMVDYQDSGYDVSVSRSEMSVADLAMSYEAGACIYPPSLSLHRQHLEFRTYLCMVCFTVPTLSRCSQFIAKRDW